jgi:hypothetical protein
MLVIKVELWPHGFEPGKKELALMHIWNDGLGSHTLGNYGGRTFRKGTDKVTRTGKVKDYPRLSLHVWNLVARMLTAMDYK